MALIASVLPPLIIAHDQDHIGAVVDRSGRRTRLRLLIGGRVRLEPREPGCEPPESNLVKEGASVHDRIVWRSVLRVAMFSLHPGRSVSWGPVRRSAAHPYDIPTGGVVHRSEVERHSARFNLRERASDAGFQRAAL
jgi:hypothetical protein